MKSELQIMNILSVDEAVKFANNKTVVIISGVTGQDGSFMVDYLLKNTSFEIFGGARRLSVENHGNIVHLENEKRFHAINFDLTDSHSIGQIILKLKPSFFINFAAQSFVKSSWDFPSNTWETNSTSIVHILEAIRINCPDCRFYNAGSSEEFGDILYSPQDEKHPLRPRSPYGASKAAARHLVKVYRESYELYAIQGWLFNHEGTRRGEDFVTRKITKHVNKIRNAINLNKEFEPLRLGNIDAKRDWSDAEDMIDAIWRMLNQDVYNREIESKFLLCEPSELVDDSCRTKWMSKNIKEYAVASGESHSIREFIEVSFGIIGIRGTWVGEGLSEKLMLDLNGKETCLVSIDASHYRPAEVDVLLGNPSHISNDLKWHPKSSFRRLVEKMMEHDRIK